MDSEANVGATDRGVSGTVVDGVIEPRLSPTVGSKTSVFLSSRKALLRANKLRRLLFDDTFFGVSD